MFFKKKNKEKCQKCNSEIEKSFSFCPFCGSQIRTTEEEIKKYGLLGRNDILNDSINNPPLINGFADNFLMSLASTLVKSIGKQIEELKEEDLKPIRGVRIDVRRIFPNKKRNPHNREGTYIGEIKEEQIKKMALLPKANAKTNIRRIGGKLIYEILAPGIKSIDDIFISKLESGYEVKAIGEKKVYANNIPINLPIKRFKLIEDKILVEFQTENEDF